MSTIDLGFVCEDHLNEDDLKDFECSRMGGPALFLKPMKDPVLCNCGKQMQLLLQLYAPGPSESSFHRFIYLFLCPNGACQTTGWSKGIKVLSYQTTEEDDMAGLLLDADYVCQYCEAREIEVDSEPGKEAEKAEDIDTSNIKIEENDTKEQYTKAQGDVAFLKFQKRLSREPDQVLRYYHDRNNDDALWCSENGKVTDIPACSCGAKRVLELQVLSTILAHLNIDFSQKDALDWGILNVYVCSAFCDKANSEYAEELCWRQEFSSQSILSVE